MEEGFPSIVEMKQTIMKITCGSGLWPTTIPYYSSLIIP